MVFCTFYPNLPIFLHRYICHICDISQLCRHPHWYYPFEPFLFILINSYPFYSNQSTFINCHQCSSLVTSEKNRCRFLSTMKAVSPSFYQLSSIFISFSLQCIQQCRHRHGVARSPIDQTNTAKTSKIKSPVKKDQVLFPQIDKGGVAKLNNLWDREHPRPECHHLNHEDDFPHEQ